MPRQRVEGHCPERILSRSEARLLGYSDTRIDTLLRNGRWHAPYPQTLATVPAPLELVDQCRAAVRWHSGGAVISHSTAAQLWLLPDIPRPAGVELTLPPPRTSRQPRGLRLHWPLLDAVDITDLRGLPVTTVARTVADIGRDPRLRVWTVVLADDALHRGLVTIDDLLAAVDRIARPMHRATIRRALAQVDGRSRSPQESRVRVILVDAGLPAPESNWTLYDESGQVVAIGDLVYPEQLLWFEYDGVRTHTGATAFQADMVRERRIRTYGFDVIHLVGLDVHDPARLAALVRRELDRAPERISRLASHPGPYVARAQAALWARTRPAS